MAVIYNYFNLRWKDGYRYVSDAPNRINNFVESNLQLSIPDDVSIKNYFDSERLMQVAVLKVNLLDERTARNVNYIHAIVMDEIEQPYKTEGIVFSFIDLYGSERSEIKLSVENLYARLSGLEKSDEGREILSSYRINRINDQEIDTSILDRISVQEDISSAETQFRENRELEIVSDFESTYVERNYSEEKIISDLFDNIIGIMQDGLCGLIRLSTANPVFACLFIIVCVAFLFSSLFLNNQNTNQLNIAEFHEQCAYGNLSDTDEYRIDEEQHAIKIYCNDEMVHLRIFDRVLEDEFEYLLEDTE